MLIENVVAAVISRHWQQTASLDQFIRCAMHCTPAIATMNRVHSLLVELTILKCSTMLRSSTSVHFPRPNNTQHGNGNWFHFIVVVQMAFQCFLKKLGIESAGHNDKINKMEGKHIKPDWHIFISIASNSLQRNWMKTLAVRFKLFPCVSLCLLAYQGHLPKLNFPSTEFGLFLCTRRGTRSQNRWPNRFACVTWGGGRESEQTDISFEWIFRLIEWLAANVNGKE